MKVSDVMTHTPIAVRADATLEEAARTMIGARVSGLPVVDDEGALIGILSEGDLLRRAELETAGQPVTWLSAFLAPKRAALDYVRTHGLRVREIMTSRVISTSPDTPLAEVVEIMESRHVKRLPVMRNGRLVGIVSRADLLRALARLLPEHNVGAISDAELGRRVLAEIDRQKWAPRTNVDVTVKNGIVELHGVITDDSERAGLRVLAEAIPGVRGVHDRLMWLEPLSGTVIEAAED